MKNKDEGEGKGSLVERGGGGEAFPDSAPKKLKSCYEICQKVAQKLLKIQKVAQKFCKVARIFLRQHFNCFVINIMVQLSN